MARGESTESERYGGTSGRHFQEHSTSWVRRDPSVPDEEPVDDLVERLGQEIGSASGRTSTPGRELHQHASELVHENAAANPATSAPPTGRARGAFVAMAVFLALGGIALLLFSSAAGIVCILMAGVAAAAAAALGRHEVLPEATSAAPDERT